jgi:hypothetical protein
MEEFVDVIDTYYHLGICELYHPQVHGDLQNEDPHVQTYIHNSYICLHTVGYDEVYDEWPLFGSPWWTRSPTDVNISEPHPSIRNYNTIILKFKLDIVQLIHLNTGHCMCILKTFWLKLLQRKYKNYYKKLQMRISRAKHPKALLQRQLTGKRF